MCASPYGTAVRSGNGTVGSSGVRTPAAGAPHPLCRMADDYGEVCSRTSPSAKTRHLTPGGMRSAGARRR